MLFFLQIIAVTLSIYNQRTEEERDGVVAGLGLELVDLSAQVQFKLVDLAAAGVRRLSHIDDLGLARLVRQPRNKSRNNIKGLVATCHSFWVYYLLEYSTEVGITMGHM